MRVPLGIGFLSCALGISGCVGTPKVNRTNAPVSTVRGTGLSGVVNGGQQPIAGASVYLYAANTTGAGSTSISLLTSAGGTTVDGSGNYYVTTNAGGVFTITGDYTCPSGNAQVYLYAVGGNPGPGTNSAAGLLAALGSCGSLLSTTFVFMDEVSTVATAFALAAFAVDATHVSSGDNAFDTKAIANAFASVSNLEALTTGVALATTPAGNGTVPQSEIDTLANILAACINSTGAGSTACSTLLGNAKNGSTTPTDTATAAINIAHNPAANVATLFGLQTGTAPFQPMLSTAPNDFTIALNYIPSGTQVPGGLAIDASGDLWIANSPTSTGAGSLIEINSAGAPVSGSPFSGGGLNHPELVAIDSEGNVWAGNVASISKFSSSGAAISGSSGYTSGGTDSPFSLAIDGSGNLWFTNHDTNTISALDSSGAGVPGSPFSGGGLNAPEGIAIDVSNNLWAGNSGANVISEFNSSGVPVSVSGYGGGGLNAPYSVAVDAQGNVWASNPVANSISKLSSGGTAISGSGGYNGGGLNNPGNIAIDGAGNVWVVNHGNSLSEFNSSGTAVTGANGYQGGGLNDPSGIGIDGSGNVWVTNVVGSLTEFVGAASPVVTPIAAARQVAPYATPPGIVFTTTALSGGTTGTPYSASIVATGGVGPLTYTVTLGSPPAGITLSSSGALSGTPTTSETSAFTVTASDAYGDSNSEDLSMVVAQSASGTQSLGSTLIGSVVVNGVPRSIALYTNGMQKLAYVCSDSQINIVDVTNAASPSVLSTFAGSVLTEGSTVSGFQVIHCSVAGGDLIVSFSRPDGNTSSDPTAVPTYFATFGLSNPLSPSQVGSTVSIDRPDSFGLLVQGNSALMLQHTALYNPYSDFIVGEQGDVWGLDLTNASTTGGVSYVGDLYPCGGINSSTGACNDTTNIPAATYTNGVCTITGTTAVPNDPYNGGPYPIYQGLIVNSTTAFIASSNAAEGNEENPSCPTVTGQLVVVNDANLAALAITTSVTVPQMSHATGVAVQGNTAVVVGDNTGIYDINSGFVGNMVVASFDITNPQNPVLLDAIVTTLNDVPGPSIVPIGDNLFVVGNTSNSGTPGMVEVNASNPSALTYTIYNGSINVSPSAYSAPYVYVLSAKPAASNNELSIYQF